ncbi:MAG TPA: hypothetical protein DEQ02_06065 [Ruminococcaceae bacterium]|nr:hypothetical protein [Oscillospiraceae bacterium]
MIYETNFDTLHYKNWGLEMQNGFFGIYEKGRAESVFLDYPPLYLFFLNIVGMLYNSFPVLSEVGGLNMLVIKFFPVVFDLACAWVLYVICRRHSEWTGLLAAVLWLLNLSQFFNTSIWGQTDQTMAFVLLISFSLYEQKKPLPATLMFAVACLTKFQCLFFAPVILSELFFRHGFKKLLTSVGCGLALALAVFIPFMIGAGDILLPLRIYLMGLIKYPFYTMNACNIYGMFGLNFTLIPPNDIFGLARTDILSLALKFIVVAGIFVLYKFTRRHSIWIAAMLSVQCIFMLTTRMHERYQIIAIPFALMAFIRLKQKRFFWLYISLSIVTFINQALVLFDHNGGMTAWSGLFEPMIVAVSALNFVLFIFSMVIGLRYLLSGSSKDNATGTGDESSETAPDGVEITNGAPLPNYQ